MVKHKEAEDFKCEAFGPGKADLERASKKFELSVEGGQRMHKLQNKKERTAVTMASVVSHKEREIAGPATTDLETGVKKFEMPVEGSHKRNKAHIMCDNCGEQCIREEILGKHGKKMHKDCGNLTCPNCQKISTKYPYTTKHIVQVHEKGLFYCTDCAKSFTGRDQSGNHLVKHSEGDSETRGQLEVLHPWNIQARNSALEDIDQGIQGGQDLKGRPPDRHLEVLDQWNTQGGDSALEDINQDIQGGQDLKGRAGCPGSSTETWPRRRQALGTAGHGHR